ncbi:hypothetical protein [Hymenobacter sp. BT190]|uniref:hypothetical protein n=1 Tax=Hymenobacter sp. BT190 TaxID=2763505 RepID=UPI0016512D65|nr:hypothetical protein [Hymenobacter sp. BT190]MBC6697314.1 hypothetical protein [Hymenobacter sp. BT190]
MLGIIGLSATAASAQTQPVNRRAENRRALRDARKYPAPYKDSHLAVNKETLKPGEGGRTPEVEEEAAAYKFDKTGAARVSEPSPIGLRLRKKKKDAPTN